MHYREGGAERVRRMAAGDIFHADAETEHVAHPPDEARVLVLKKEGSVQEAGRNFPSPPLIPSGARFPAARARQALTRDVSCGSVNGLVR